MRQVHLLQHQPVCLHIRPGDEVQIGPLQHIVALRIDAKVLAFAFIASAVTAVICGLAPTLQTRRTPLVASLMDRSRVSASGSVRMRKALVAGQLAFTLVLLIGSGLFVQTLSRLHYNLGFDGEQLVTLSGGRGPNVDHEACEARGDDACLYRIIWERNE